MSSRPSLPSHRQLLAAPCLALLLLAAAALCASTARAANYKMVMCAATNGVPAYTKATNAGGLLEVQNSCDGEGGDPPGEKAYLRIWENQTSGLAPYGDYARITWTVPSAVAIARAGGYTREPSSFNQGWRARLWVEGFDGSATDILLQDTDASNSGVSRAPTASFQNNLWPGPSPGRYRRFSFELVCVRAAGCDESGLNAADANGFVFTLSDEEPPGVALEGGPGGLLAGEWVGGGISSFNETVAEHGSGVRAERTWVDGIQVHSRDHAWECNTASSLLNGEWAKVFVPCSIADEWKYPEWLDTGTLADGAHVLAYCAQDFGQFQGLDSTNRESCDTRTIRVDNTAPGAPSELRVTSANRARYLDHFGAHWSLPPNEGSPIETVHYEVVNSLGDVVVPEEVISAAEMGGANPTEFGGIEGPEQPGEYTLRLWLQDSVGKIGPAATAPIPHDTIPPAAPQGLSVTAPATPRSADGLDVRWRNIVDAGAPIDAVHYQVLNAAGAVVVPTRTVNGDNIQAIQDLEAPNERGNFTLRLWLSDAEGNVGAPVSAPLSYQCVRSSIGGGQQLAAALGATATKTVAQGDGATLSGYLHGAGGNIAGAPLCIFSQVVTDAGREFLGIAITGAGGDYRFAIAPGPSRDLSVAYRLGQRELSATARIQTVVHPTFKAKKRVVRNKHFAYFDGEIPGPHNDQVVIVLQAKVGKGWLAFHRYRTRNDGHFELAYRFNRTTRPTNYEMRAQVRETTGYPYLQGDSDPLVLRVLPDRRKRHLKARCARHKRVVKGHGKAPCGKSHGKSGSRRHH